MDSITPPFLGKLHKFSATYCSALEKTVVRRRSGPISHRHYFDSVVLVCTCLLARRQSVEFVKKNTPLVLKAEGGLTIWKTFLSIFVLICTYIVFHISGLYHVLSNGGVLFAIIQDSARNDVGQFDVDSVWQGYIILWKLSYKILLIRKIFELISRKSC